MTLKIGINIQWELWEPFPVAGTGLLKSIWDINSKFHAIRKNWKWSSTAFHFKGCYLKQQTVCNQKWRGQIVECLTLVSLCLFQNCNYRCNRPQHALCICSVIIKHMKRFFSSFQMGHFHEVSHPFFICSSALSVFICLCNMHATFCAFLDPGVWIYLVTVIKYCESKYMRLINGKKYHSFSKLF